MDIISTSTIELTSEYIKSASQTYNFPRTTIKPSGSIVPGGVSLASKVPPLSFYFDRPRLQECFYESHRNEKTEKDCMQILRTSGTLICGKVITKNEHGVFIKVLFLRKEVSPSDASKKRWDSIAENVSDYDSCKVFCKKQDMADNFEGDNIKQNTVVVAIVKNFDRIAANRVNVSMLNEDYAEKDLEEILCIPNSDSNFKFREPLGSNANYFGTVDPCAEETLSKNTAKSDNNRISSHSSCLGDIKKTKIIRNPIEAAWDLGQCSMLPLKRPFMLEEYYDKVKDKQSKSWAMGRVEKGLELLQAKKYESALKKFKEAKHLDATFANAPKQIAITMRLINTAKKEEVYSQQDIEKELSAYTKLSAAAQPADLHA